MRHAPSAPFRPALGALIAGLVATLLPGAATPNDDQVKPPTFGTEAEVVMLDLVARSEKGKPVTDLKKREVTVFEDGKPCEIVSFRFVGAASRGAGGTPPSTAPAVAPGESAVAARSAEQASSPSRSNLVVLVFDRLNTRTATLAREGALKLISSHFPPDTWVAVYYRRHLIQPFTSDGERLETAVKRATFGEPGWRGDEAAGMEFKPPMQDTVLARERTAGPPSDARVSVLTSLGSAERETMRRVAAYDTLYPLIALSEALRPFNARKSIVYFAEGWQFDTSTTGVYEELISAANRSNTTIHTVNAMGLFGGHLGYASVFDSAYNSYGVDVYAGSRGGGLSGIAKGTREWAHLNTTETLGPMTGSFIAAEDSLRGPRTEDLADDTGGLAIKNTNDLGAGLAQVVDELEHYYEVVYLPPNPVKDGRFRHVRVDVARRGVQVRTRAGYFASRDSSPTLSGHDLPLLGALVDEATVNGFPFEAGVLELGPKGPERESLVLAEVPVGSMLREVDESLLDEPAHLRLLGHVTGARGEVIARLVQDWPAVQGLTLRDMEANPWANVLFKASMTLKPGSYGLALAVEDTVTGRTSAARQSIEVPETKPGLVLSSLSVLRQIERGAEDSGAPLRMGDMSLYPSLSSKIPIDAAGAVPVYVSVYPDQASPPVELTIEIGHADRIVGRATTTLGAPEADGRIPWLGTLQMAGMEPGAYQLTARARQGERTAETHTSVQLVAEDAEPSDDPAGL